MLLRAVCYRGSSLAELAEKALSGGSKAWCRSRDADAEQGYTHKGMISKRLHHHNKLGLMPPFGAITRWQVAFVGSVD